MSDFICVFFCKRLDTCFFHFLLFQPAKAVLKPPTVSVPTPSVHFSRHAETSLETLVGLGFSRDQADVALTRHHGSVTRVNFIRNIDETGF